MGASESRGHNVKPISLYPLTLEQALRKAVNAKPPVKGEKAAKAPAKRKAGK
jgi:hypothetical protein